MPTAKLFTTVDSEEIPPSGPGPFRLLRSRSRRPNAALHEDFGLRHGRTSRSLTPKQRDDQSIEIVFITQHEKSQVFPLACCLPLRRTPATRRNRTRIKELGAQADAEDSRMGITLRRPSKINYYYR